MKTKKIIIVSLIANTLSACSSPPKLSEPEGDWISFEPALTQPAISKQIPFTNSVVSQPVLKVSKASPPAATQSVKQLDYSKLIFVGQDGKNQPLYQAVRYLVPVSWSVKLSPEVAERFKGKVSWTGNDQWPYVLDKMLRNAGLDADIDDSTRTVVIVYRKSNESSLTKAQAAPAKIGLLTGNNKVTSQLHPPIVPVVTQAPSKPVVLNSSMIVKPLPPVPAAPVLQTWKIDKGPSLKKAFKEWVDKEKCPVGGGRWNFEWLTDTDYAVDYPLTFSAVSFEAATAQLFSLYRKAESPLYVIGYRQQCLIRVSDNK